MHKIYRIKSLVFTLRSLNSCEMAGKGRGKSRLSLAAPAPLDEELALDWSRCIICQGRPTDKTVCPAENPIPSRQNMGYIKVAANLEKLKDADFILPSKLSVLKLDGGEGIERTLQQNSARWHPDCIVHYRQGTRLDRLVAVAQKAQEQFADPEQSASDSIESQTPYTRSRRAAVSGSASTARLKTNVCFLCNLEDHTANLTSACTKELHKNIEEAARKVGDTSLIALLATGDVISLELKYHLRCLTRLYNKARRLDGFKKGVSEAVICEGIAFSDLAVYIQSTCFPTFFD
jgi:hypothetical protein